MNTAAHSLLFPEYLVDLEDLVSVCPFLKAIEPVSHHLAAGSDLPPSEDVQKLSSDEQAVRVE